MSENIFESKWGFHPCDRETYKKLKKVRYYIHINNQQYYNLQRWAAKQPQNRFRRKSLATTHGQMLRGEYEYIEWAQPELCKLNLGLFQQEYLKTAPKKDKSLVKKLNMTVEDIDKFIENAEMWLKSIGKDKR